MNIASRTNEPARPPIAAAPITAILPAHNQVAVIDAVAGRWLREFDRLSRAYELLLVDDGSTDGTAEVMEAVAARSPTARVIRHERHQGFGACLRSGLSTGQHPLVFVTACDYPYQPNDFGRALEAIDTADIVCGVRKTSIPSWLQRLGTVYRWFVRIVLGIPLEPRQGWYGWNDWWQAQKWRWTFGVRLHDPTCAFQLFRKSVFDRLPVQSDGSFARIEVLAKANFMSCLLAEVPIGRLSGTFRGAAEPEPPGVSVPAEAARLFRSPSFGGISPPPAVPVETPAVPDGG